MMTVRVDLFDVESQYRKEIENCIGFGGSNLMQKQGRPGPRKISHSLHF